MKNLILLSFLFISNCIYSQGNRLNTLFHSLSTLDFNANTQMGSMAGISAVSSPLYSGINYIQNPALLHVDGKYIGGNISYNNLWNDWFLSEMNFFYSNDKKSSFGYRFQLFRPGETQFTNLSGIATAKVKPTEFFHQLSYAHKISNKLSLGVSTCTKINTPYIC